MTRFSVSTMTHDNEPPPLLAKSSTQNVEGDNEKAQDPNKLAIHRLLIRRGKFVLVGNANSEVAQQPVANAVDPTVNV